MKELKKCNLGNSLLKSHAYSTDSEKAMAPHSSTLAWKIPRMEEPGRLQSMPNGDFFLTRLERRLLGITKGYIGSIRPMIGGRHDNWH